MMIQQEALLHVLERAPTNPLSESEEVSLLALPFRRPLLPVGKGGPVRTSPSLDSDDDSVFTASTASFSDTDSEDSSLERRVSFAEELVTDEWTRPYTPREEVTQLFYSQSETSRFRQEYRMERKLLSELSVDPDTFPVDDNEELSALVASSCSQPTGRHSISRVVVLHNDKLETFSTPPLKQAEDNQQQQQQPDAFFDNDSFWSGSITWY